MQERLTSCNVFSWHIFSIKYVFHISRLCALCPVSLPFAMTITEQMFQSQMNSLILRIRLISVLSIYRLLRSTGFVANQSHFTPAGLSKLKRLSKTSKPCRRGSINPMDKTYAWSSRNTPAGRRHKRKPHKTNSINRSLSEHSFGFNAFSSQRYYGLCRSENSRYYEHLDHTDGIIYLDPELRVIKHLRSSRLKSFERRLFLM